ncbi:hypothetical protein TPA0908_33000 [Micromonospora sp. AKA38]|nr:hypothetical protein TPA0908_33000 [Micromonospora sp. AKA38]
MIRDGFGFAAALAGDATTTPARSAAEATVAAQKKLLVLPDVRTDLNVALGALKRDLSTLDRLTASPSNSSSAALNRAVAAMPEGGSAHEADIVLRRSNSDICAVCCLPGRRGDQAGAIGFVGARAEFAAVAGAAKISDVATPPRTRAVARSRR